VAFGDENTPAQAKDGTASAATSRPSEGLSAEAKAAASQPATEESSPGWKLISLTNPKGPPLPLHTIEGVGGIMITPTAYLVNPGPKNTVFGLPAASFTFVGAGEKNIETFAFTETILQRVELGYAISRFGTGTLDKHVKDATGVELSRDDVYLNNFNIRGNILPENSFGLNFLPAVTAGVHFKVNDGISQINSELGGALSKIGYRHSSGVDYTLTASKTIPKIFGRPLILSAGLRLSEASQLGYVGFGDTYHPSFEGNATYLITNWLAIAYEYRQKPQEFGRIDNLVRPEQAWQTIGLGFVLNPHLTATVGYGHFDNVLDTVENGGWAIQVKYEL
jgi:hypothetical protein